ncbi:hypothetical protein SUS17_2084 [Sphingomonas sp. S17]|nr:hypothetical protein SUS17_2084 [Sphingomonas sp. S17]
MAMMPAERLSYIATVGHNLATNDGDQRIGDRCRDHANTQAEILRFFPGDE